jgi:1,2-diacylglycerol-3-alpha-glucose alpha-1,2-galactosyltransferase
VHTAYAELTEELRRIGGQRRTSLPSSIIRHIHSVGPLGSLALRAPGPSVVTAHLNTHSFDGSIIFASQINQYFSSYLRRFYGRADAIICLTHQSAKDLAQLGVSTPTYVVPNVVSSQRRLPLSAASRREARDVLGLDEHRPVILRVGQLQARKGIDHFLAAAAQRPDYQFVWVGDAIFGVASSDYVRMNYLKRHPPKNVVFTGVVARPCLDLWYQAADVFFSPSLQETFGLVIVEAAAAGLPVVASRLPEFEELFGAHVALTPPAEYASTIDQALQTGGLRRILLQGSAKITELYVADSVRCNSIETMLKIYSEVLSVYKIASADL